MPPTVQTGNANERKRPGQVEKRSDLVCRMKYSNSLPDIPFDPKFITYPFESNRFVQYKPTSLERNYKYDLLTEHDLGVTIDLINPDIYAIDAHANLHPDDERLLEEDSMQPQDTKRSRHHNKAVPWLKKTEYIATEFNRYGSSNEKTETKVGYNVKKLFKDDELYMDRESQIAAINKTFTDANKSVDKHYSKPGVKPVEIFPVFPDFDLWKYPFAQVMFDSDPAAATQTEEMSQAMIRGVMDESGEQFVAYFLPTEDTIKKRKRDHEQSMDYLDEEEYEYKMAREYNWNVKNKASKGYEENYFFIFRGESVYYNELETRVRLSKRRLKAGVAPNNSRLVVTHRPMNEAEMKTQEIRQTQLDLPVEEEEDEEEAAVENKDDSDKESAKEASDEEVEEEKAESGSEKEEADKDKDESEAEKSDNESVKSDKSSVKKSPKAAASSSSGSSSSSSGSSASSSSESEEEEDAQKKRDEAEIFGSESDSD